MAFRFDIENIFAIWNWPEIAHITFNENALYSLELKLLRYNRKGTEMCCGVRMSREKKRVVHAKYKNTKAK